MVGWRPRRRRARLSEAAGEGRYRLLWGVAARVVEGACSPLTPPHPPRRVRVARPARRGSDGFVARAAAGPDQPLEAGLLRLAEARSPQARDGRGELAALPKGQPTLPTRVLGSRRELRCAGEGLSQRYLLSARSPATDVHEARSPHRLSSPRSRGGRAALPIAGQDLFFTARRRWKL